MAPVRSTGGIPQPCRLSGPDPPPHPARPDGGAGRMGVRAVPRRPRGEPERSGLRCAGRALPSHCGRDRGGPASPPGAARTSAPARSRARGCRQVWAAPAAATRAAIPVAAGPGGLLVPVAELCPRRPAAHPPSPPVLPSSPSRQLTRGERRRLRSAAGTGAAALSRRRPLAAAAGSAARPVRLRSGRRQDPGAGRRFAARALRRGAREGPRGGRFAVPPARRVRCSQQRKMELFCSSPEVRLAPVAAGGISSLVPAVQN